ncbi:hypothetical protein AYK25_04975 [Thermoplasmatales archaeon SM1-50]|nr:MAG: hypothetical protein AYK25_04975 [Thermoplasmatales archaeon SM1-50]
MGKKPLIVISLCAVVLLVLGSLSNVVGYQTVQSSNQRMITNEVNQRELLLQTVVDIANNKEIQQIILKSQMSRGIFPNLDVKFSLTKNQLKLMYMIGLSLSKTISKSRIHSIDVWYQFSKQGMQKEIYAVIEKDPALKERISKLQNSECDCENKNTSKWNYTGLCILLFPLYVFLSLYAFCVNIMFEILHLDRNNRLIFILYLFIIFPFVIIFEIGWRLDCFWGYDPYLPTTK